MTLPRFALFALVFFLTVLPADARHALYTITPQVRQAGGLFFDITSRPLPEGTVEFQVVISENQARFNAHPLTEVGLLRSTESSRSINAVRKLTATRKGKSLTCVFTVDRKSLQDPNFCFLFSNLEHAIDEKLLFLVPADFVFARLKEFAPRRP